MTTWGLSALVNTLSAGVSDKKMTGGLGWVKNTFSSCKRTVVECACDIFLLQLSLTNSYMLTDFSEDELAVGNAPCDKLQIYRYHRALYNSF